MDHDWTCRLRICNSFTAGALNLKQVLVEHVSTAMK